MVTIVGSRITLRPWRASDAPAIRRATEDPLITRWSAIADEGVDAWLQRQATRIDALPLAIALDDDRAVGRCALGKLAEGSAELSYWLVPEVRGCGLAHEAAALLVRYGFDVLGLTRIVLDIEIDNGPSLRVAESLGARRARRHRERDRAGVDRDLVEFVLSLGGLTPE